MTSKELENIHTKEINKVLLESGIECVRSVHETIESESIAEEEEQALLEEAVEAEEIELAEAEDKGEEEEAEEETPSVFPTPSLRKILPERIRKAEGQNRIHVLPENFKSVVDPWDIPKISLTPPQKYIDILADLVGCHEYKSSLAEYWFLDTLANALRRGQEEGLTRPSQAVLILWFCEWTKEMQYFDAADRERMLRRFQDNMLSAAQYIADEQRLPAPADIGVYYKETEEAQDQVKIHKVGTASDMAADSKHLVTFEGAAYECSLLDLTRIIHYIYDLFSSDYQYDLVRSIFTNIPQYTLIDAPYQVQQPKCLYMAPRGKSAKEKSPKKEKPAAKGKGKSKEEVVNAEYIALMELKQREEKELAEIEALERDAWLRKSQILPLTLAANDEFFNKYWPPPPPEPEPEPVPVPDPKAKDGKGKGKK